MPEIYGSSRIRNVSGISTLVGPTGSTGPAGPTGATGATGPTGAGGTFGVGIFSGLTGASGGDGIRFFREGEYGGDFITFYLTDGTTLGISGARGATGEAGGDFIISNTVTDAGYGGVFDYKNGITAYFRNLTVSGRDIEIESNDYSILLRGITYDSGILGNTGELLYQFDGLSAHGAKNTYWDNANNNLLARILVHKEADDSNNLTESGTNYSTVVSPSKLEGDAVPFTYMDLAPKIDPNPQEIEKPFEGFVSFSGLHLGKTADDAGVEYDWVYTFPGSTFSKGITAAIIGSCCYCEDKGTNDQDAPNCIDYVTKQYCSNVGGVFDDVHACIERPEGPNCYVDGACCLFSEEGRTCVQTVSEKCERFGGFFIPDLTCDELQVLGDEDNPNGCPNPCRVEGACCINNVCFEMTEYECSLNPNGGWIPNQTCEETNCCLEAQFGACCLDEVCYNTTPIDCATFKSNDGSSGIFWGVGSKCAGPYEESRYYAYNCTNSNGEIIGTLENGVCADGEPPPCTSECLGWTQIVQDECVNEDGVENICKCLEDVGGPYQCDCNCDVCGSNTEESCGSIKLADGSCWECCCPSDDLPEPTTTTTTTQAPLLGYCCQIGDPPPPFEGGDGCLYYDENNEIQGNCNWGCYYGEIDGCIYQGAGNCDSVTHSMRFVEYQCSYKFIQFLNAYRDYNEAYDALMQEEPYASQCFYREQLGIGGPTSVYPYLPCVQVFDPLNPGAPINCSIYGDYETGFEWTFTPYDDSAPMCSVWRWINNENVFNSCPERGNISADVQCTLFEDITPVTCPDSNEERWCFPQDCCPEDVTTNPPFPDTTEPPVLPLRGGGGQCYSSTSEQCDLVGGQWYTTLEECENLSICGPTP